MENKFQDQKIGDEVVFFRRHTDWYLLKIKRITKTQIIVEIPNYANQFHERRFYKKDGYEVGSSDSYHPAYIVLKTDELMTRLDIEKKQRIINENTLRIPLEQPELINEVYTFLTERKLLPTI